MLSVQLSYHTLHITYYRVQLFFFQVFQQSFYNPKESQAYDTQQQPNYENWGFGQVKFDLMVSTYENKWSVW